MKIKKYEAKSGIFEADVNLFIEYNKLNRDDIISITRNGSWVVMWYWKSE